MPTDLSPAAAPSRWSRIIGWVNGRDVPISDPRFWVIQMLVLGTDLGHLVLEDAQVLVGESDLYLLSVSVLLIPVVYAALTFGLRGAVPTVLWAFVLSLPEISLHGWTTRIGILTQFCIVLAIAVIVALRVDREKAAARTTVEANRRLSRLNATTVALADSLDLDHVLRATLRAKLDPRKHQVAWIRLLPEPGWPGLTVIDASGPVVSATLDPEQEGLTLAACVTGKLQFETPSLARTHTLVAPLKSEGVTVGALGLTQSDELISEDEFQVHTAIARQLGVALSNIRSHDSMRAALADLSMAKENLEVYVELATEAQEEERKRLSRELHDDILQCIVVAKGQIESVTGGDLPERSLARLLDVQEILSGTIVNVRRYCRDLRPSLLDDLGLVEAVEWLVDDLRSRANLIVDLEVDGRVRRLGSRDELLTFRVIQEGLHNVERHAEATHVGVGLTFTSDTLVVTVKDNGRGMAPTGRRGGHPAERGLGLRGMDERTKLLRGELIFESRNGEGTIVELVVPLPRSVKTPVTWAEASDSTPTAQRSAPST
jgi:signal transduction histidine kinase